MLPLAGAYEAGVIVIDYGYETPADLAKGTVTLVFSSMKCPHKFLTAVTWMRRDKQLEAPIIQSNSAIKPLQN